MFISSFILLESRQSVEGFFFEVLKAGLISNSLIAFPLEEPLRAWLVKKS